MTGRASLPAYPTVHSEATLGALPSRVNRMSKYADERNAALNGIIEILWRLPSDETRCAVFATAFSVLAKKLDRNPIDFAGQMCGTYVILDQTGLLDKTE